ncbi:MAG: LPS export ABC transporter permease LptF [Desulfobacterales bacterium]|nr:LPS export ABC transporter permease LptF [Desulfobacterales bacterium]
MKLTLYKYLINEIWPTFFAALFVVIFIALATRMLSLTELIVMQGVAISQVAAMVVYLLPDMMAFTLPAAGLIAVVVAFLRLSGDSEIIALRACGISLYQMLPPVVLFSFLGFLIATGICVKGVPWGNSSFKELLIKIAESKSDLGIKEHIFSEPFDDVVFYVNEFSPKEKVMGDVFVVDRRDKEVTNTIVAEKAGFFLHPEEKIITLRFQRGTIFVDEKKLRSGRTIEFDAYDLNIGLKDIIAALASRKKRPGEMTAGELIAQMDVTPRGDVKYNKMMIELLEKLSLPLAVFLMGIIGVPLGAQMRIRGRAAGIGLSLVVFIIYYMCLAGVRNICETGILHPAVGVWIPDLFLLLSCAYLLRRVANECSIDFSPRFLFRKISI